jgi:CDP-glucose 4,6-dehydratase
MAASLADQGFWAGKRVLLTGHTGFKGSWLALWLTQLGAHVTGVGLEPDTTPNLFGQLDLAKRLVRHHIADICDPQALAEIAQACQPDVVLHLAAQPLVRRSYQDPLGTWATNVQGSLQLLEALKPLNHTCAVVMVTTDKVYANREWAHGYRETDRLGGHDPYSASKAAAELAIASWRASFYGDGAHQTPHLRIATARAGNVIGGGDWATDRIVPDAMRALAAGQPIAVRNPQATRPWQHVLEPLGGYLLLAQQLLSQSQPPCDAFNFGPMLSSNRSVAELVKTMLQYWNGTWVDVSDASAPHEAGLLHLQIDKAHHQLSWRPSWDYAVTLERTVHWYKDIHEGADPYSRSLVDLHAYQAALAA